MCLLVLELASLFPDLPLFLSLPLLPEFPVVSLADDSVTSLLARVVLVERRGRDRDLDGADFVGRRRGGEGLFPLELGLLLDLSECCLFVFLFEAPAWPLLLEFFCVGFCADTICLSA